ncbi:MAG: DUF349 domain-containing protein [Rhodoferax sp.]
MNTPANAKKSDLAQLDELTHGAFTAPTAGERAARIRDWLATQPTSEQLAQVFRELSVKDKGAAKLVRERIDEARRIKDQEALSAQWADKAQALLGLVRLNIADAMAWQRDAAKAGAPLSREPLAALKTALAERVRGIEDLQHRAQVQREAAVLLAQRIEVLSTKPWQDAQALREVLQADVGHWQAQALALTQDSAWDSVEARFTSMLDGARTQLLAVWDAFSVALAQAVAANEDPAQPLPSVPVWADALRSARGEALAPASAPSKPPVDPEQLAAALAAVESATVALEQELAQGHGKASAGAAQALRAALKEHAKSIDHKLDARAHAALAAAGELEGWQRWRSDQLREELVRQAESLLQRPAGQSLGGRKMQESLRALREQWKQSDQGGAPNHGLWRRFDAACNEAYKVVESWLEKSKAEAAEHKKQRQGLVAELQTWAQAQVGQDPPDWKAQMRALHQLAQRWRDAGHVGDKVFTELQGQWKTAMAQASKPLEDAQAQSLQRRNALIEEARQLAQDPQWRMDALKALQQRWQAEAQGVPLERRQEQKLWDAFRKPLDEAFERRGAQRDKQHTEASTRDRGVLEAARALEDASRAADSAAIRSAMQALEEAVRQAQSNAVDGKKEDTARVNTDGDATETVASRPAKPIVAVRGDDRPGHQRDAAPVRDARAAGRHGQAPAHGRSGAAPARAPRAPATGVRLGDQAFRAQRDAMDKAQAALRQLASQAHGEAVMQVLRAWQQRDAAQLPSAQALGVGVNAATRTAWGRALEMAAAAAGDASALLRLEIAAEVPTPAAQLAQRRQLQLQLLTQRHASPPAQTWGQDVATVLSASHDEDSARRLQTVLKALVRR